MAALPQVKGLRWIGVTALLKCIWCAKRGQMDDDENRANVFMWLGNPAGLTWRPKQRAFMGRLDNSVKC
jgi:hypothetical protein